MSLVNVVIVKLSQVKVSLTLQRVSTPVTWPEGGGSQCSLETIRLSVCHVPKDPHTSVPLVFANDTHELSVPQRQTDLARGLRCKGLSMYKHVPRQPIWPSGKALGWQAEEPRFDPLRLSNLFQSCGSRTLIVIVSFRN